MGCPAHLITLFLWMPRNLHCFTQSIFPTMRFLPLLLFFVTLLTACMGEDDYTVSPNDRLTFSTDTVALDTVISGSATSTSRIVVYNKASKAVRIAQVGLERGAASPFKLNVDGTPLTAGAAADFEIAANDSLIVFLMANVPESNTDEPTYEEDKLYFTTEAGVTQKVVLTAWGQTVETLRGCRIAEPTTFASKRPYRIMDSLVVEQGQTLALAPGCRLYFHPGAELVVHGSLVIQGTPEQPVVLRGDRMGNMFTNQPYDRIPGQWGGVRLTATSYDNYFNHTDIHSGTYGVRVDSSDVARTKLIVENSIIHNTAQHALDIRMAQVYVGNSQLTNAGGDCLHVRGGNVTVVHSTLARLYVFTGGSGAALDFANFDGGVRLPLESLQFANSIITGYQSDEIMGNQNVDFPEDAFNYAFFNCLLNTPQTEEADPRMVDCLWDQPDKGNTAPVDSLVIRERNFTPEPDLTHLLFSFQLAPGSKAIGTASPEISALTYPTDRLGRPRGEKPDMGCYQHN